MKIIGIEKAVEDYLSFNGNYKSKFSASIMVNLETREIWTDVFETLKSKTWKNYKYEKTIDLLLYARHGLNQDTLKKENINKKNVENWAKKAIKDKKKIHAYYWRKNNDLIKFWSSLTPDQIARDNY